MNEIMRQAEEKMSKTGELFRKEMLTLRAGRAHPSVLDKVTVDYFGTPTPVNQLATINVPEPRLLTILPWDRGVITAIEKAIMKADLGLTPSSDGTIIRLNIPALTQDRRRDLVKNLHKRSEEEKVTIRNLRRAAVDGLKAGEKDGRLSEDECHRAQDEVQKLTDKHIREIETLTAAKEKEILEV